MTDELKTSTVETFLKGEMTQVDVSAIEDELRRLWRKATDSDTGMHGLMRACSSNFVVVYSDENEVQDIVDEILTHHPSRAVLARFNKSPDAAHVNAWVSARCQITGSQRGDRICSDQITVHAEGPSTRQLSSVIRPLMVPDLPVFLWWRLPELDWQLIEPVVECSSALIVDSGAGSCEVESLKGVAQIASQAGQCFPILDINWTRLNNWQRGLANAFDGYPLSSDMLSSIRKVEILYQASERQPGSNQALLLGAWLSSRLNWTCEAAIAQETGWHWKFNSTAGEVSLSIQAQSGDQPLGYVSGIELDFGDRNRLILSIDSQHVPSCIAARLQSPDGTEVEFTPATINASEATLLVKQLEAPIPDTIYGAALELAVELVSGISSKR